jgi:hypothetical protein
MFLSRWQRWLSLFSPSRAKVASARRPRRSRRPYVERLEDRCVPTVSIINGAGSGYVGNGGGGPPDVTGMAGPNSYLEVTNDTVTLFNKSDGTIIDQHPIFDFFYNPAIGNEPLIYSQSIGIAAGPTGATEAGNTVTITTTAPHGFIVGQGVTISGVGVDGYNGQFTIMGVTATTVTYTDGTTGLANSGGGTASAASGGTDDSTGLFDNLMGANGRFIIGDIDVDPVRNVSQYVFAVSTSSNPTALDAVSSTNPGGNWNFYHVTTTEGLGGAGGQSWSDYPGNPGFNADAFVETFNMFGKGPQGTQVVSINASDLANGVAQASLRFYSNDVPGGAQQYRPTTMHDSVAGDPMWLIHNDGNGADIHVVKMTNVLSNSASFDGPSSSPGTMLRLPVPDHFLAHGIGTGLNPDGSGMFDVGSRILKAGEYNNTIVAAHAVPVASGPNTLASAVSHDGNFALTGGSGYSVGDTLTVVGGTFTTPAQLTVQTVDSNGMITAVTVANPGSYTSLAGIDSSVTGGTGAGATFSLFFTGELVAQWYAIDVSSGTPAFQMVGGSPNVGRVGFGANTYCVEPAIDINSSGQIGLGFMESDTVGGAANAATGGFLSTFVTARQPTDAAGTMQPVVLVPAATGSGDVLVRIGDFSGMNVDPVNGTFWHVNEFGGDVPTTAIANFTPDAPPVVTAASDQTGFEGLSQAFDLGSFADPDGAPWGVTVSWGDGTADSTFAVNAAGALGSATHAFAEEGTYTVTVTVTDFTGLTDSKTYNVSVSDHISFDPATGNLMLRGGDANPSNDAFRIERDGLTGGLEVSVILGSPDPGTSNVTFVTTIDPAIVSSITVDAGDGSDALTIDLSNGNPIPFGGITYNGGSDNDEILVTGSDAMTYVLGDTSLFIANSSTVFGTVTLNSVEQAVLDGGPSADDFEFSGWTGVAAVNGGGGADHVVVTGTAGDDTVAVTGAGVSLNSASILFSGSDAVPSSVAFVTINGGLGKDTVKLSPTAQNLDELVDVTVNGGGGFATAILNDQNDQGTFSFPSTWNVDGSSVTRSYLTFVGGFPTTVTRTVHFHGLSRLVLNGGSFSNFSLSPTTQNLDELPADVTVNGGGGVDTATVDDQNDQGSFSFPSTWNVDGSSVTRSYLTSVGGFPTTVTRTVHYNGLSNLVLNGGSFSNFSLSPTTQNLDELPADVTVNGGGGVDSAILDDQNDQGTFSFPSTWNVDGSSVTRSYLTLVGGFPTTVMRTVHYNGLSNLVLNGGSFSDFSLSPTAQNLDELPADVTVNGSGGIDTATLNDQNDQATFLSPSIWAIDGSSVARSYHTLVGGFLRTVTRTVQYNGLSSLVLNGGSGPNTFNVSAIAAGVSVTVNAGPGDDTTNVGNAANSLDDILGPVTVNGGDGNDVVNVNDQGDTDSHSYGLSATQVVRSAEDPAATVPVTINYGTIESLAINLSSSLNTFNVVGAAAGTGTTVNGGTAFDNLIVAGTAADTATWQITGTDAGQVTSTFVAGTVTFTGFEELVGSAARDRFVFSDGASIGAVVGGAGEDTLDYSAYTTPVRVNLATLSATGLSIGTNGDIEDVIGGKADDILIGDGKDNVLEGGPGNDVLIGGDGNDTLRGGPGRDLLIGGLGSDVLIGGDGEDILIGGYTSFDTQVGGTATTHDINYLALQAIMAEWTRTDLGYNDRIQHLRKGGGLNGNVVLDKTTVFDDGVVDTLTGGAGRDWFFKGKKDVITDLADNERIG